MVRACLSYFIKDSNKISKWGDKEKEDIHDVPKYGIVLAGFIFKPTETMEILEANGMQDKVISDLLNNDTSYNTNLYDKKVKLK